MKKSVGILLFSVSIIASAESCKTLDKLKAVTELPASQILIVKARSGFQVDITACELKGSHWVSAVTPTFPGVIGKNGMATQADKHEGDWKTPTGFYPIGPTFGTEPMTLKMDYRYITSEDKFIDDPKSPQYNTWIFGKTNAKSFETMLIPAYKLGAVVQYNMNPTIAGKGSAIFLHMWRSSNAPTAGCIAMAEPQLLKIINWFEKSKHPYIYVKS